MAAIILIRLNSLRFHRHRRESLTRHLIWVTILWFVMPCPKASAEDLQWPSFLGAGKSFIKENSLPITWGVKQNKIVVHECGCMHPLVLMLLEYSMLIAGL